MSRAQLTKRTRQGIGGATDRYRAAEQGLWRCYGLQPIERTVTLPSYGIRLRIDEIGDGAPILFVPGTGGVGPYWAALVKELGGFRCLVLDRPGWGVSTPIDYRRHEYKTLVADLLREAMAALGVDRAHVVGASVGGHWAMRLASQDPARVTSVVTIGTPLQLDSPPTFLRVLASPVGALMVRMPPQEKRLRSILSSLGHRESLQDGRIPEEYLAWRLAFEGQTDSMRHEREMVRAVLGRGGFRPGFLFEDAELAGVTRPVLQIFGSEDPTGTTDSWTHCAEMVPDAELRLLEGAGHVTWLDDPALVGGWVRSFVDAHTG